MEKRGVIEPGLTPPEHEEKTAVAHRLTAACENTPDEGVLDVIRRLDGDFRKEAAERARKAL